jgi:hypothetical protein
MTRLAPETITDNPWLRDIFGRNRPANNTDYLDHSVFNDGKEELYYPVLERMIGRDVVIRRAPVDVVLLPCLDLSRKKTEIMLVPEQHAQFIILDRLLNDRPLPEWLPLISKDELNATDTMNARALAQKLPPVYEVTFGSYETRPIDAISTVLSRLM